MTEQIIVSTTNSTTSPLAANELWQGMSEKILSYQEVDINICRSPYTAVGTLIFEFSPDGVNWDVSVPLTISSQNPPPVPLRVVLPHFRVRYVNGPTSLTELRITTVYHRQSGMRLTRFLDQSLDANEPVQVVRAVAIEINSVTVANFPVLQPVSVAALPLPAGAATEETVGKRFTGGKNTSASLISSTGDNVIYAPSSGKTLTLFWIFLSSSQNNTLEALATVRLGAKVVYETYLGSPGAFAHWEPVTADHPDDALVVHLSDGQSVAVNFTTDEA